MKLRADRDGSDDDDADSAGGSDMDDIDDDNSEGCSLEIEEAAEMEEDQMSTLPIITPQPKLLDHHCLEQALKFKTP